MCSSRLKMVQRPGSQAVSGFIQGVAGSRFSGDSRRFRHLFEVLNGAGNKSFGVSVRVKQESTVLVNSLTPSDHFLRSGLQVQVTPGEQAVRLPFWLDL